MVGNLHLKTNISVKVLNVLHPWQIAAAVNSPAGITKQHFTAAETGDANIYETLEKNVFVSSTLTIPKISTEETATGFSRESRQ